MGHNLQPRVRVARQRADCRSRRNAAKPAGIRHDDALDILDDIAAGGNLDTCRKRTQRPPCSRRAVGNRDRLRAAHRTDQLPVQNLHIGFVGKARSFHVASSFFLPHRQFSFILSCSPLMDNPSRKNARDSSRAFLHTCENRNCRIFSFPSSLRGKVSCASISLFS